MTETGILNALPGALKANGPKDEGYRVFLFFFPRLIFLLLLFHQTFSLDAPRVYVCVGVPTSLSPSPLDRRRYMREFIPG